MYHVEPFSFSGGISVPGEDGGYDAGTGCTENGVTSRAQNVINSYFEDENRKGCVNYGTPMTAKEMKTKDFAKNFSKNYRIID